MVMSNRRLSNIKATDYNEKYQEFTMEAVTISFNASLQALYAVTEAENAPEAAKPATTNTDNDKESVFKKAINAIREVIEKILSAFLEKTNKLIKGLSFERYKKERGAINSLGDAFYKTIQSINFTGYFGTNLDGSKMLADITSAPLNVPAYSATNTAFKTTIKNGWADDNAFTAFIAPGLKNIPNATAGNNAEGESLGAKVKRFYNNNGETIEYKDPAKLVAILIKYCDGYNDDAAKSAITDLNTLKTLLNKTPVGESWFELIDEMFIVTENESKSVSSSNVKNEPSKPASTATAADTKKEGIVEKPSTGNDPTKKANNENNAYEKNLQKYLNALINIEAARMTILESCFIDSLKQLHEIYTKAVKDGFIKEEETETTNTTDTGNKINPA